MPQEEAYKLKRPAASKLQLGTGRTVSVSLQELQSGCHGYKETGLYRLIRQMYIIQELIGCFDYRVVTMVATGLNKTT